MKILVRAVTILVLLAGVGGVGVASAQRGRIDVGIGVRPWVRGHVFIGPRYEYQYRYHYRPYVYRYQYRRPLIIRERFRYHGYHRPVVIRRGHRSHYRWY